MRLEKQLTVGAPPDQVWAELLDVADLAACLPGAEVTAAPGEPVVRGELTLGSNGSGVRCRGTVRPVDADEDERTATLRIQGREVGGSALATALLRGHVGTADGATTILVSADLDLTGQRADPATVRAEAQRLLDGFSERLEARIRERAREPRPVPAAEPRRPEPAATPAAAAPDADAGSGAPLDAVREGLAATLGGRAQTYGLAAGVAILVVLLRALLRPRRHITVSLKYRW
jgi:carbon monoxide dehydrogenase subunit G